MTDGLSPAVDYRPDTQLLQRSRLDVSPQLAGRALYAALAAALLSMVAISLFFGGAGAFWGPVNDILVSATVLLLLPAVVVVRRTVAPDAGRWLTLLSIGATGGAILIAAGQLALVARLIPLETSFITGTIGVLPLIAWIGGTAVLALRSDTLGRAVGWWALGFLSAVVVTSVAIPLVSMDTPTLSLVFGGPLLLTLVGWMVSLARDLGRRGA